MAEDDDAEGFGDFTFVTAAVDPNPKINGRGLAAISDDDWGDFVTDNTTQIKTPVVLIPFDPFGFSNISNGSATSRPDSQPIRVDAGPEKADKTRWVKPQGALPLSLFGDEQEEEESGAGDSTVGDGATGSTKNEGFVKKESNLNANSVGINDLIANLYGPNPKTVVQNGSDSNLGSGGPNSIGNGLNFGANAMDLKFDTLIPNGNGKFGGLGLGSNGLDLKFDGVDSNSNVSGSKLDWEEGKGDFDEDDDDDDDDGWEFKAAESERRVSIENLKEQGVVEVAGSKVGSNAHIHPGIQVDEKLTENTEGTGFSGGFSIDAPESNNVSVPSPGTSHRNGEWGFLFDFNPSPVTQDNFFSDPQSKKSKQNSAAYASNSAPVDGNLWGFKDALSENGPKWKLEEAKAATASLKVHPLDGIGAHAHNDLFAGSHGDSHKSGQSNFAFPFIPNSGTKDGVISDLYSSGKKDDIAKEFSSSPNNNHVESDDNFWGFKDAFSDSYSSGKKDDIAKELNNSPNNNHVESDDNIWEFKDAFAESRPKLEGEPVVACNPPANIKSSALGGEIQHNEVTLENHRLALPLSIFGDEELENDDSSIYQNISTHTTASHQMNTTKSPASNISITDLISNLYSQVDQNTNSMHEPKATENTMHPASTVLESESGGDDFDDDSWEFKDAVTRDQGETSLTNLEISLQNFSTEVQLDSFLDFYCKLKDETYALALYHLDNKKKAQSSATLSGEDTTAETLEEEIQKLYNELHQDNMMPDQFQSGNLPSRNTYLHELREVLQDPKFQVLESEYKLSQRLSLAENDLRSAIELSRHSGFTLRILKLGSTEEQSNYISTWSQIVSFCAQELKHGSLIWMQSLEKNVQNQILSEPQGKQYILALGEIYRLVLVLGASIKLYKPWIVLHNSDCSSLLALLNECSTLWSSSGLDEALKSISDAIDFNYDGTVDALLDTMTYIHHLDAFALQNHVVNGQEPICSLSLLTAGAVPGIQMVVWNGEHYLLTLANLWTNLISPDPPQLPHLRYS